MKKIFFIFFISLLAATGRQTVAGQAGTANWKKDPAWYQGKAEWALYDAQRVIYGTPRTYEARIFTNKQYMDQSSATKTNNSDSPNATEVFKHNVSEIIPTENYTYRFLTTSFIRTDNLTPFKVVVSTQEDCGSTYKQFLIKNGRDGEVAATSFAYFPQTGKKRDNYSMPGRSQSFHFHDDLTLTLRDYPFDHPPEEHTKLTLVPDQTDTRETPTRANEATIEYLGRETVDVPYGRVETHHLRVTHEQAGNAAESNYFFAADSDMRHVLVKYNGPYGVAYELRKLAWWKYWDRSQPQPHNTSPR